MFSFSATSLYHHCPSMLSAWVGPYKLYSTVSWHCLYFFIWWKTKQRVRNWTADCWWVCVDWWDVHISSTHSRGRSAPRWSHTGCRARCPESHAAPCRTHTVLLLNSVITTEWQPSVCTGRFRVRLDRLPLPRSLLWRLSGRLFLLVLWTRVSLFSWAFLLFLQNLQNTTSLRYELPSLTSTRRHIIVLLFSRHPGAAPTFLK